jgi:hypothetical protein
MPFRWYQICRRDDLGTKKTWKYDKLTKGALSALAITVEAQNGASGNKTNPIYENVVELNLVDGSYIAWALPGPLARAQTILNTADIMETKWSEQPNGWQGDKFLMQFGDYLGDPNKYVQLSEMANPLIQVDWDEGKVRAAGADSYLSDSGRINVLACIDTDKLDRAPGGFHRLRKVDDWTSLGSGDHDTTIDTDFPVRSLFERAYYISGEPGEMISKVKLSFDSDAYVPIDEYLEDVMQRNVHEFRQHQSFGARILTQNGQWFNGPFSFVQGVVVVTTQTGATLRHWNIDGKYAHGAHIRLYDNAGAGIAVDEEIDVEWFGYCPLATVAWRWGAPGFPVDPLPANRYSKGSLKSTHAIAGAACTIGLEQIAVQPAKKV